MGFNLLFSVAMVEGVKHFINVAWAPASVAGLWGGADVVAGGRRGLRAAAISQPAPEASKTQVQI